MMSSFHCCRGFNAGGVSSYGKAMNKITVAESVENEAIMKKLRTIGVDYAPGYGINYPAPIE